MNVNKFLKCTHCGYTMYSQKKENTEDLHDRFFRKHILVDHLKPIAQMESLLKKQKLPN